MNENDTTMTTTTDTPATGLWASGRHPVNVAHLVMGIAFLGIVAMWAAVEADQVVGADVRWLLPVPWVLAGLAGLLATTLAARRNAARRQAHGGDEAAY